MGTTPICPTCMPPLSHGVWDQARHPAWGDFDLSVAPTIAKLLGLTLPNVEGRPLAGALGD